MGERGVRFRLNHFTTGWLSPGSLGLATLSHTWERVEERLMWSRKAGLE
jgi:hypothetical protein